MPALSLSEDRLNALADEAGRALGAGLFYYSDEIILLLAIALVLNIIQKNV